MRSLHPDTPSHQRSAQPPSSGRSRLRRLGRSLVATVLVALAVPYAFGQEAEPWSLLTDEQGIPYVTTADPATGFPRPGDDGELFFLCEQDTLLAGAIVDAGPPDVTAVESFVVGGDVYAVAGGENGWYVLDNAPGAGEFAFTAAYLAAAIHEAFSVSDGALPTLPVAAQSGGQSYPLVEARTGPSFGPLLEQLPCIEPGTYSAASPPDPGAAAPGNEPSRAAPGNQPAADGAPADAPADDPFADAPNDAADAASGAIPRDGEAFAALLEAGGDVRLPAGTFTLASDVVPIDDLRLTGAGVGATILRMPAIEFTGLYAEGVDVTIQGMTIVVDGPALGLYGDYGEALAAFSGDLILRDLVIVNEADHGELGISGVTLLSGTLSATDVVIEGFPFAGVYLEGGVANLRDTTLRGNRNGVQVEGYDLQPYAELRDVILEDNEWAGIAVYANASALVTGGTLARNGSEATFVSGTGSLTLENLSIEDHASYGVVAEGGRAVLRNVTLRGNANAVWALLDSTVTVERSDILSSTGFAVAGNGTGSTTLRRVTIDGSELSAVHAEESRSIVLESVLVRGAGESGVNLLGDSRGEVRDSRVEGAAVNGIEARDASSVTVVDTTVASNAGYGILVTDGAKHDLQGVVYDANGAGSFQLPGAGATPPPPTADSAPARPSRPSRSGAGTPSPATPATPATPSTPDASASGSWQLGSEDDLMFYDTGTRGFGFVCGFSDSGLPVVYLSLPDVTVPTGDDDVVAIEFARSNEPAGSVAWMFLALGDGLYVTDDVATDDIAGKLLPDEGSEVWNTVVVGVEGQEVLSVPGEARVAELYVQLTCTQ